MSIEFDSSDFEKKLDELSKNADNISGTNKYSFEEIFTNQFMSKNTNSSTIEGFFNESPFEIDSQKDFDELPETELDKYVSEKTIFSSWSDMLGSASEKFLAKKLGL